MSDDNNTWPNGFDQHKEQQIIRMAQESTPGQRLEWVEEMLELMALTGKPYLERKRQFMEEQIKLSDKATR